MKIGEIERVGDRDIPIFVPQRETEPEPATPVRERETEPA